ncbi:MAG: aspartate aminotransferase family protein [Planctomycetota bacterium]
MGLHEHETDVATTPSAAPAGKVEELLAARGSEVYELHRQVVNPQFVKVVRTIQFDRGYVRGLGQYLWDAEGNRYLDLLSGYGTFNVGRNHPRVRAALHRVLDMELPNLVKMDCARLSGFLAEALLQRAPQGMGKVFFANSGTEAVEAAIKFARAATGKNAILYWDHAFHGLTMGSLSLNGSNEFRAPFGALLADARAIPFDDLAALERELKRGDVAALFCEPIQGKGVYVPSEGFFREAKALCERHGALLVLDEVQTGGGRTGTFLACEQFDVSPHMITLAKFLSGGMTPVGAVLLTDDVHARTFSTMDKCIVHGSTFCQNDLAMAAGLATLEVLDDDDLINNAARLGGQLMQRLDELKQKHPIIKEVRGRGLMIAVEFGEPAGFFARMGRSLSRAIEPGLFTQAVVMNLLQEHRILSQTAAHKVDIIKFLPTLCISQEDVDHIVSAIDQTLATASVTSTMLTMGKNLGRQVLRGS